MMNYKKLALTVAAGAMATTMMAQSAPQLNANNIDEVIKAMTLEEKAQMLVGGGNDGFVGSGAMLGHQKKFVPGAAGTTVAIPRLGIPTTVQCDGPAGVHIDAHREGDSRSYFATGFPIGTCLASTWNTDLVRKVIDGLVRSLGVILWIIASIPLKASSGISTSRIALPTPGIIAARSLMLPIFLICWI